MGGIKVKLINLFQFHYLFQHFITEGIFSIEGIQHNALEQVAKSKIQIFRKPLKYFQQSLFQPYTGLYPFHFDNVWHAPPFCKCNSQQY